LKKEERLFLKQLQKNRQKSRSWLTKMEDPKHVLEIRDLKAGFFTENGLVRSVDGVSFSVPAGKTVCLVGESGCGKSVTGLSLLQLLQRPHGQIFSGNIRLQLPEGAYEITRTPEAVMETLRGGAISMIFQEPMSALNPVLTVGYQLNEVILLHDRAIKSKQAAGQKAKKLLEAVGLPDPERIFRGYPHNLSGGQRQRVCIAMALACQPRLIIADEPTTALDVTIQAQILTLLKEMTAKSGSAVLLITHDLGVVAEMADLVVVMYAGRVVEQGTAGEIFANPAHPYTQALMAAKPVLGKKSDALYAIGGTVPDPIDLPKHCYFHARCDRRDHRCIGEYPVQLHLSPTHKVSCYRAAEGENHDR